MSIKKLNKNGVLSTLCSSSHVIENRAVNDYYATDPVAVDMLLKLENFDHYILEPCAGEGAISEFLKMAGYNVKTIDCEQRNYELDDCSNFLKKDYTDTFLRFGKNFQDGEFDIITNPPYNIALEFVEKSIEVVADSQKVAMFLRTLFLESAKRYKLFRKYPPKKI